MTQQRGVRFWAAWIVWLGLALGMTGCGVLGGQEVAPLKPLPPNPGLGQRWHVSLDGSAGFFMQIGSSATTTVPMVAVASAQGVVVVLHAQTGQELARARVGAALSSGVGFDGNTLAVTTLDNALVALTWSEQKKLTFAWKKPLPARVYTAPLVAGGRVFVQAGDRSLYAFDAADGSQLWTLKRPSDPLTLSQVGALGVYKNTLLAGHGGRLLGVNPDNGLVQAEWSVATSRATNDIERLIDLVGAPNRVGDSVCVRSFQTQIGCVDMAKSQVLWTRPAQGATGVAGDAGVVVACESDGRLKAWQRSSGEALWSSDQLVRCGLSAPLVLGNSVVVGDAQGLVHVLKKATGEMSARFQTDGSPIVAAPVALGEVVIVLTQKGGVYAYSPK